MKKQKETKNDYDILENEIERNLYCIKKNKFIMNQEFEEKYKFCFKLLNEKQNIVILKGNYYKIEKNSRIIEFIIDEKSQSRFIYSYSYLQDVFQNLKIEYYSTTNDILNDDSIDSEICLDEIIKIFNDEDIVKIYKIKLSKEKIIDLFNRRYPTDEKKISDLFINTGFYYNNNSEDDLDLNILEIYYKDMENFIIKPDYNILYLIGPKGTSKSLFLSYFFINYNMTMKLPILYINYIKMKNLDSKKRKNIFKKEMIYLFFNKNILRDFYQEKYHRIIISDNNIIFCLKKFLENLIKIYENVFITKSPIIFIIDNFDENEKLICDEMENIINLVKSNSSKIKLIISGHSDFINNKLMLFTENDHFLKNKDGNVLLNYNIKIDTENEIKTLPAFYYRKDLKNLNDTEIENILLDEEIKYCEKFNILGMFYSILNNGKQIDLKFFNLLPIEYLYLEMEDNCTKLHFFNPIFLKAVKKKFFIKFKEASLLFLLKECNKYQIIKGIFEEKLLTLAISYNKIYLNNLNFCENNILEIYQITDFYDIKIKKYK